MVQVVKPDLGQAGIDVICASRPLTLTDYMSTIGVPALVSMIVGDTQRVIDYPRDGFAEEQRVPPIVHEAYARHIRQGFTPRLA